MIDRPYRSVRLGAPLLVAALLVLAGCASDDGEEEGQAVAVAVDDADEATTDDTTGDEADDEPGDDDSADEDEDAEDEGGAPYDEDDPYEGEDPYDTGDLTNDCTDDGCLARIIRAEANGDEVVLTFDANFQPDGAGNHFHIYWDNWDAEEVSASYPDPGTWAARAEYPDYDTGLDPATSTAGDARGDSDTLCVTPADASHVVIDPDVSDCWDLGDLIG